MGTTNYCEAVDGFLPVGLHGRPYYRRFSFIKESSNCRDLASRLRKLALAARITPYIFFPIAPTYAR